MPFIGNSKTGTNTPTPTATPKTSTPRTPPRWSKEMSAAYQERQTAAQEQPAAKSDYTLILNNGRSYDLNQEDLDWIKKRYQSTAANAYKDNVEDQVRKSAGQLPLAYEKGYKNSTLDQKLFQQGLPSERYIEDYIGAYVNWVGDGQTYSFDKQMSDSMAKKYRDSWEYEYTFEDQDRKAQGKMPAALEKKYGDNYRDYQLMQQGLPPESMLSDYVGAWETVQYETAKRDQLYNTVTQKIMQAEYDAGGYKKLDEAARLKIFNDVYVSSEYDDVRHLFQKSPVETDSSESPDELSEYDAIWAAMSKEKKSSDEPLISYADFANGYESRKSTVLVDKAAYDSALADKREQTTASLKKGDVQAYVESRSTDNAVDILNDMYDERLSIGRIREAKDYLLDKAETSEDKKAINAKVREIADSYTRNRYSASANAELYDGSKREKKQAGDTAVKNGAVKQYETGATSTINADDAEKIFNSHLVYDDKGKPTKESIILATNMMYEAGASTPIVLEVGKRTGMRAGILSKDYADKQKESTRDAMMGAYQAQESGVPVSKEEPSLNDLTAFNSAFADVVSERDLAQRKELMDASYKANVESGNMTSADFFNAVRRAGWGDTLNAEKEAEVYYKEVYAPKFAANGEQLPAWEEINQAEFTNFFENGKALNPDIHKTSEEIVRGQLSQAFTAGIFKIISGSVGFVDMATAKMNGRTDIWEFTKRVNEATAASQGVVSNQSIGSQLGGLAATISEQLVRMYAVSQIGSGVLSMFSKAGSAIAGAASQTNAGNLLSTIISNSAAANKGASWLVNASKQIIKSSPFITNAMGSYYSEAMSNDATVEQATAYGVIGGLIEGATEAVGTELWLGRALGSKAVAKGLIKSAINGTIKGESLAAKAVLINLVASALGNGLEEMASYAGTWLVKRNTYDKDAQFSLAEMWDNGKLGMLVSLFGAGLGMAEDTNANTIAKFLNTKKGMEWANGQGIGSIHDLFIDAVIADNQTEQFKNAVAYQDSVESSEAHKATWNDIEAMTRQLDEGQQKYNTDMEKISAELTKKQDSVAVLSTKLEQVAQDKSAAGMKKWSKIAEQLRVAQSELDVETAQAEQKRTERTKAYNESVAQQNIALEKAQARYAAHSVGMTIAFESEIKGLKNVNADMAVLGKQILSKMDAARAGKLKEYVKAHNDALNTANSKPVDASQPLEATTAQPAHENAPTDAQETHDAQKLTTETQKSISTVAISSKEDWMTAFSKFKPEHVRYEPEESVPEMKMFRYDGGYLESQSGNPVYSVIRDRSLRKVGVNAWLIPSEYNIALSDDIVDFFSVDYPVGLDKTDSYTVLKPAVVIDMGGRFKLIENGKIQFTNKAAQTTATEIAGNIKSEESASKNVFDKASVVVGNGIYEGLPIKYDAAMRGEASNQTTFIKVSDKFFDLSPEQQVHVLNHEVAHNVTEEYLNNADKFIEVQNNTAFGQTKIAPKGSAKEGNAYWEGIFGDVGANSVVETFTESIATYLDNPKFMMEKHPDAYAYIAQNVFGGKSEATPANPAETMGLGGISVGAMTSKKGLSEGRTAISQFYTNTLERMDTDEHTQEVRNAMDAFDEAFTYDVVSEKESIAKAQERLARGVTPEIIAELRSKNTWSGVDVDVAMAIKESYRQAGIATGNMDDYANWSLLVADRVGEGGRALQSLAKYTRDVNELALAQMQRNVNGAEKKASKKTKETIAKQTDEIAKTVDNAIKNGETPDMVEQKAKKSVKPKTAKSIKDMFVQLQDGKIKRDAFDKEVHDSIKIENGLPTLSTADATRVIELLDLADQQTDDYERRRYQSMAAQIIANTEPITKSEKLRSLQRIEMLMNPKTMIKNIAANPIFMGAEWIKDAPATLVDKLVSNWTGERTTTVSIEKQKAWAVGFKRGASEAIKDIKYGVNTGRSTGKYEMTGKDIWRAKWMNSFDKAVGYGLNLGDRPFYEGAYDEFLMNEKLLGHDIESDEVQERIIGLSLDRVFQAKPKFAEFILKQRNALDSIGIPIGSLALPFAQTPANLADKILDYSIGTVRALTQLGKAKKTGEFNQKLFVDRIGRSITGKGLMILGFSLAKAGIINLSGDDDKERQAMKNAGVVPYSLQLGDVSVAINWAEPVGSIILMGAMLAKSGANGEALNVIDGGKMLINSFFDNGVLQNLTNLLGGGYGDVAGGLFNFILGTTTQFMPSGIAAIARISDPYERDTYDPNVLLQQGKKLMTYFPGLRQLLPFKYGTDGKPVESNYGETLIGRMANTLINPALADKKSGDAVNDEIYRLYQSGFTDQLLPTAAKTLANTTLTAEQRRELQRMLGEATYSAAERVINSGSYESMTDEQRVEALSDAITDAATDARNDFKSTLGK